MIFIEKIEDKEPPLLKRYHEEIPEKDWKYSGLGSFPYGENEMASKQIKGYLADEQGYICAYCMKSIDVDKLRIEHWRAQNCKENPLLGKQLATVYTNFLGVCRGIFEHEQTQHCEKNRGDIYLHINPLILAHIREIKYSENGTIYSDNTDFQNDLNVTLHLNYEVLRKRREEKWEGVEAKLAKVKQDKIAWIEKELEKWKSKREKDGKLQYREFCGFVIYRLEKELGRAANSKNKFYKTE